MKNLVLAFLIFSTAVFAADKITGKKAAPKMKDEAAQKECIVCHIKKTPAIVDQWKGSTHFKEKVGCLDCHQVGPERPDGFLHHGKRITPVVTPKTCATCHKNEADQFQASHHADAGKIVGSLDNILAEVVEGHVKYNAKGDVTMPSAALVSGCLQCHGSEIKVLPNGKLDPATWPNTGIGRLNPDGSKGSCSACHLRHEFSSSTARQPENCGRCHLGPDHPHLEIYKESKHGISFEANRTRLVADMKTKKTWIPGKDYETGPTCSSCHMGATLKLPVTHDVGARISWTLRPPVSEKIDSAAKKAGKKGVKSWENRRDDMQQVCAACHAEVWVENFYTQFDNLVNLYNDKFGTPATQLMKLVIAKKLIPTDVQFTTQIEFTYYYLWHHEGRRARHGAAMMGPDYTQWHGMMEVADRFYTKFVPELKVLIKESTEKGGDFAKGAAEVQTKLDEILNSDMHRWSLGKMTDEEKAARKKSSDEFKKRYAQ
jgi:nitrate/TMAO reductase-like tetraheme cytochrome c subunit